eukprot:2999444-Alexandrium_andersonii.AAC.1
MPPPSPIARRCCPQEPCTRRTCLAAVGESTGAGLNTTGGAVPRIHLASREPRTSSDVSGARPLTKSESPTTNVRIPRRSRWGSSAAMAAGMAGRGRRTTQAPSKSAASYT